MALHNNAPLLWGTRVVILLAVVGHIIAAVQLQGLKRKARPCAAHKPGIIQATPASRTMIFSGLPSCGSCSTTWPISPGATRTRSSLTSTRTTTLWWASTTFPLGGVLDIVAMVALGMHLSHGAFSLFFSLGLVHPKYNRVFAWPPTC